MENTKLTFFTRKIGTNIILGASVPKMLDAAYLEYFLDLEMPIHLALTRPFLVLGSWPLTIFKV